MNFINSFRNHNTLLYSLYQIRTNIYQPKVMRLYNNINISYLVCKQKKFELMRQSEQQTIGYPVWVEKWDYSWGPLLPNADSQWDLWSYKSWWAEVFLDCNSVCLVHRCCNCDFCSVSLYCWWYEFDFPSRCPVFLYIGCIYGTYILRFLAPQQSVDDAPTVLDLRPHGLRVRIEGQQPLLPPEDALLPHDGAPHQLLVDRELQELQDRA